MLFKASLTVSDFRTIVFCSSTLNAASPLSSHRLRGGFTVCTFHRPDNDVNQLYTLQAMPSSPEGSLKIVHFELPYAILCKIVKPVTTAVNTKLHTMRNASMPSQVTIRTSNPR